MVVRVEVLESSKGRKTGNWNNTWIKGIMSWVGK